MINEIISGISVAINSEFGDHYDIYTEDIEQGLTEPCFSIVCLNPTISQVVGKRYLRNNQFCIHYFPSTNAKRSECYSVMDRLMKALEVIKLNDGLCRGTSIHCEIVDSMLHFFVNYNIYVFDKTPMDNAMESVEYQTDVKG